MKRNDLGRVVLVALLAFAGAAGPCLGRAEGAAQTQPQARSMPMFEVDASWPKVPAKWKLGDASSIAIDAQDNVWVLHRPPTLKPRQARKDATPLVELC